VLTRFLHRTGTHFVGKRYGLETMFLEDNNKTLIRAHYNAMINWFEPDAVRQQIADDFFDHQSGRHMSAEDQIAYAQEMHAAFSELSVTLNDVIAEGERVAVRVTWRGTHVANYCGIEPTGKRFEFTGIVFWRVREGKIVERWAEVEFSALIAQLSVAQAG
jgi:steroid delta-isomerase-like uncharacterized protein